MIKTFIEKLEEEHCDADIPWFETNVCKDDDGISLLIVDEANVVGYIKLLFIPSYPYFPPKTTEIHALYILPSKRRLGFAKKMLQIAEQMGKERGFNNIGLGVGITQSYQVALSLYISCGYKPDGLGLYHSSLPSQFACYGDTITIDSSTTMWFIKSIN